MRKTRFATHANQALDSRQSGRPPEPGRALYYVVLFAPFRSRTAPALTTIAPSTHLTFSSSSEHWECSDLKNSKAYASPRWIGHRNPLKKSLKCWGSFECRSCRAFHSSRDYREWHDKS